jgi:hypothetical protein
MILPSKFNDKLQKKIGGRGAGGPRFRSGGVTFSQGGGGVSTPYQHPVAMYGHLAPAWQKDIPFYHFRGKTSPLSTSSCLRLRRLDEQAMRGLTNATSRVATADGLTSSDPIYKKRAGNLNLYKFDASLINGSGITLEGLIIWTLLSRQLVVALTTKLKLGHLK